LPGIWAWRSISARPSRTSSNDFKPVPVRQVLTYPHPKLRIKTPAAGAPTRAVRAVAQDLLDTMRSHPRCVGLAAPQIGELIRVIVVDVSAHPRADASHGLLVLVDPVVTEVSGAEIGREGCLSLPDITANVRRPKRIRFEATLLDGVRISSLTAGFEARAILHEIDHLDGVLVLDRVASPSEIFPRRT
jgi:peptide deformylase